MGLRGTTTGAAPLCRMGIHGSLVDAASAVPCGRQTAQEMADHITNGRMVDHGPADG